VEGSVPRSCRQTGPECVHHAVNRGNRKTAIFHKPGDYKAFLRVLAQAKAKFPMRILAFCLMRNHWHLVLWPDRSVAISAFMHWLTSTHVRRYHLHYDLVGTGHLYQDRFRNDICTDARGVLAVINYVEGNPLAAGIVRRAQDWKWSSLRLRLEGDPDKLLSEGPVPLPENWVAFVNENTALKSARSSTGPKRHRYRTFRASA
jgi:putative transposase